MARRKKGRGRTTPKGTGSPNHDPCPDCGGDHHHHGAPGADAPMPPPAELLLRDGAWVAEQFGDDDLDDAEVWASAIQEMLRPQGVPARAIEKPEVVLRAAERDGGPAGAVVAAAIAAYGPPQSRAKAAQVAERLRAGGVEAPGWVDQLGVATPVRAAWLSDVWGDGGTLILDCERGDGQTRGVGLSISPIGGMAVSDFAYGSTIADAEAVIDKAGDEFTFLTAIDLADARALAEAALVSHDVGIDPDSPADIDGADARALVEQRFALLPDGGTPPIPLDPVELDENALIEEFLDLEGGVGYLSDAEDIAVTICDFARYFDGDPLRWSPSRVRAFVEGYVPEALEPDKEWLESLTVVLEAWLQFAADKRDLPDGALAVNLKVAAESCAKVPDGGGTPAGQKGAAHQIVSDMVAEGIDLSDETAVQAWMDRYNAGPPDTRH